MIPYGRQDVTADDIAAVVEVLGSDWLTQGPAVERFESAVAAYCGAGHGVAVNSATSALHIACMALDVGPGDHVWTSPNTFLASANCALYCGAAIDFVDIDPQTYNMCPRELAAKLERAATQGHLPKVVIVVHFAGQSCAMREIHELSVRFGFRVIEDASHAVGGRYLDSRVGDCRYSDIAVFSFHPVKLITTAEGGMAMTRDPLLAQRMMRLRSHGMTRDAVLMDQPSEGPWYYQQIELGYNYRLTDIQAVLGISQLARLEDYVERRHAIAERYREQLQGLPVRLPHQAGFARSALHLYPIQIEQAAERRRVFDGLRATGIGVNVHYIPVHTQPYYRAKGFAHGDFPVAEQYYARAISLPMYPTLASADQDHVISTLRTLLR
ncbi:MAG: UDP-4-amino-4,6-dideoxy-N-acetyl-beta-L-altrosamine transaminase [Caldimonas sp.]